MPDFGTLNQKHPDYDEKVTEELDDLYVGGYQILKNAERYLPRMEGEHQKRYIERLKVAAYVPYFGEIVDEFSSELFEHELKVTQAADADNPTTPGAAPDDNKFYLELAHDADRKGMRMSTLLQNALTCALVHRRALIGIDFPRSPTDMEPRNRKEEEELGLDRAYVFDIPIEQLINWELDDVNGGFKFAVLHRHIDQQAGPFARRGMIVREFKVWFLNEDGRAEWQIFRTRPMKPDEPIQDDEPVPQVDGGVTSFDRVPLISLEVPAGLWVGNKIGPLCKEHFQRRNVLNAAENKSLFAVPYVALGSEIGAPGMAMPSAAQQDENRGRDPRLALENKGYLVIGSGDKVGFAEPSGACYSVVEHQLRDLKDEIHRVVHQMAASVGNMGATMGRSGKSKREDRTSTAVILGALGKIVRDCARQVYKTISTARGEDITWVAHGLDQFSVDERETVLEEAVSLGQLNIPSATFKKQVATQVALQLLPTIPSETADAIRQEIEDGVDEQIKQQKAMAQAPGVAPGGRPQTGIKPVQPVQPPTPPQVSS